MKRFNISNLRNNDTLKRGARKPMRIALSAAMALFSVHSSAFAPRTRRAPAHPSHARVRRIAGSALLTTGLVAGSLLLAPGTAFATSAAGVSGIRLTIDAEPGKANNFRLGIVNTTISITDTGDFVLAGAGCTQINRNTVECDATSATRMLINTGDLDDTVDSQVLIETTVNAGFGNDQVTTSGRDDTLNGGGGNDTLNGGAGADRLSGGADADVLNGGPGRDSLDGGTGPDVFNGGADIDEADYDGQTVGVTVNLDGVALDGAPGEGDNVGADVEDVLGGAGNDVLTGSNLANVRNRLVGDAGADTLVGLAGQDLLVGNDDDDTLSGGDGPDTMIPGAGKDTMSGGPADDEVSYAERNARVEVSLDGVANDGAVGELDNVGTDMEDVTSGSGIDKLVGNDSDNVLIGGTGGDFLDGRGGRDFLGGNGGNDNLNGGDGDDTLSGGPDADTLNGGRNNDLLHGDDGDDTLSGGVLGAGNDGTDRMIGDLGFDTVDYSDHGGLPVTASLDGIANDGATGVNEGDNVEVESIIGGSGADVLIGDNGPNRLLGGKFPIDGGDQISGNGGDDQVLGGFGNDTLSCGSGIDSVDGGPGIDTLAPGHGCELPLLNIP